MLWYKLVKTNQILVALLLFISTITFPNYAYAKENKNELSAEDYRKQGFVEQRSGNLVKALECFEEARSLGLNGADIYNDIGVLYEKLRLDHKAEKYYLAAIDYDNRYLPPYLNLAMLYQKNGFKAEALKYFKLRYEFGDPDDDWTIKAMNEALEIDPSYQERIDLLAAAKLEQEAKDLQAELVEESRVEFGKILKSADKHYKEGKKLLFEKKYKESDIEFKWALQLTPNNPKVIKAINIIPYKMGEDLFAEGEFEKALIEFDRALKNDPENLLFRDGRKKAVKEILRKKIKQHADKAILMLDSDDSTSAKEEIQKILIEPPKETKKILDF